MRPTTGVSATALRGVVKNVEMFFFFIDDVQIEKNPLEIQQVREDIAGII